MGRQFKRHLIAPQGMIAFVPQPLLLKNKEKDNYSHNVSLQHLRHQAVVDLFGAARAARSTRR